MEKVRPWCGQPSDRGRLKNRTEQVFKNFIKLKSKNPTFATPGLVWNRNDGCHCLIVESVLGEFTETLGPSSAVAFWG